MTTVSPTNRGIEADHDAVPAAVPASPFDVLQRTAATAPLAVPLTGSDAAVVETMVVAGAVI